MPNYARIMARLLPLMDLSILLLGLFIVLLTFARFHEAQTVAETKDETQAIENYVQCAAKGGFCLFPVFAACDDEGYEKGKLYRISGNFQRGDEISVEEIRKEVQSNGPNRTIVCLVTSEGVDDSELTRDFEKKQDEIKGGMDFDVVRITNVDFKN